MNDVTWHEHAVCREDRERQAGHPGCVVWFTGLSGSGKSTIANLVDQELHRRGIRTFLLDGDNIRHGLCASPSMLIESLGEEFAGRFGLGFSAQDRQENIRRVAAVSQLMCEAGLVTLTAFVSPYRRDRDAARRHVVTKGRDGDFVEVFVDAPLDVCEGRDPKGLYQRARAGEIRQFTGIDDPYEPPAHPELMLNSASRRADELARDVVAYLQSTGRIPEKA